MTGTISHGTLRPQDLIPVFIDVLDELIEEATFADGADHPQRVAEVAGMQNNLGNIERESVNDPTYFEEACDWDLAWLFDRLDEFAPDGHYFGAHPGDGSDFGFWPHED